MTRAAELLAIEEAVAAGRCRRISQAEAMAYDEEQRQRCTGLRFIITASWEARRRSRAETRTLPNAATA